MRQCSQMQPGVCVRQTLCSWFDLVSWFHILFTIIIILTKIVHTSSAWHRTPTGPSHTRGRTEVSEPLGTQCWWHFDSYSASGNAKFASPMYKHPQCRCFLMGPCIYAGLSYEVLRIVQHRKILYYSGECSWLRETRLIYIYIWRSVINSKLAWLKLHNNKCLLACPYFLLRDSA